MNRTSIRISLLLSSMLFTLIFLIRFVEGLQAMTSQNEPLSADYDGGLSFVSSQDGFMRSLGFVAGLHDFNGDDYLDVMFIGAYTGHINLWLNDGSGGLIDTHSYVHYEVIGQPRQVEDVDNDGDLDFLIVEYSSLNPGLEGTIYVYENNGNGYFAERAGRVPVGAIIGETSGDFDNDGDADFLISNSVTETRLFINEGHGNFSDGGLAFGGEVSDFYTFIVDVDNDLDLDLINYGLDNGGVWLNNGSGHFVTQTQSFEAFEEVYQAAPPTGGDFDKDGDTDFVAGDGSATWFMLNQGDGTFITGTQLMPSGQWASFHEAVDLDMDNDLDLVTVNFDDWHSKIWLNDGLGNFALGLTLTTGKPLQIWSGDLDNDGDPDLIVPSIMPWQPDIHPGDGRSIWLNNEVVVAIDSPIIKLVNPHLPDLNHQVWLQASALQGNDVEAIWNVGDCGIYRGLVITTCHLTSGIQTATVTMSNELGTVTATVSFEIAPELDADATITVLPNTHRAGELAVFSLDVSGGTQEKLYFGDGQRHYSPFPTATHIYSRPGTYDVVLAVRDEGFVREYFTKTIQILPELVSPPDFVSTREDMQGYGGWTVHPADYDGDGTVDILVSGAMSTFLNVLLNPDGSALFSDTHQFLEHPAAWDSAVGDVDGDFDLDLVLTGPTPNLFLNNGEGYFYPAAVQLPGNAQIVRLADLDGDLDLDLIYAYEGDSPGQIYWNDGAGQFITDVNNLAIPFSYDLALGHLNDDDALDMVVAGESTTIWLNDGAGSFTLQTQTLSSTYNLKIADIDGDLVNDIVLLAHLTLGGSPDERVQLWHNDGTGSFSLLNAFGSYGGGEQFYDFAIGDLDGNGLVDLAIPVPDSMDGDHVDILFNQGAGEFVLGRQIPTGAVFDLALSDLDGDD